MLFGKKKVEEKVEDSKIEEKKVDLYSQVMEITTATGEKLSITATWSHAGGLESICTTIMRDGCFIKNMKQHVRVNKITWDEKQPEEIEPTVVN